MKSKASIKGHPIHPILIAFPVAFFTGTVISDIAAFATADPYWAGVASVLTIAGVVSALIAAVPGLIDYFQIVPTDSKKTATYHLIVNSLATTGFLIAWLMREEFTLPSFPILLLEVAGLALMSIGGWLGGSLVYKKRVGVETPSGSHARNAPYSDGRRDLRRPASV